MKNFIIPAALAFLPIAAHAQDATPSPVNPAASEPVSTLMFFTLGAALLIAVVGFVWFLNKRSNRDAADKALNPKNPANR